MARTVSLIVLVAVILVIGLVSYRVMAGFLLPMFLALVLVVLFRPMHVWITARLWGRDRVAAGLTTLLILLIVLLPVIGVVSRAAGEALSLAQKIDQGQVIVKLRQFRERLGFGVVSREVETSLSDVESVLNEVQSAEAPADRQESAKRLLQEIDHLEKLLSDDQPRAGESPPPPPPWEVPIAGLRQAASRLATADLSDAAAEDAIDECGMALHEAQAAIVGSPLMAWIRQQTNPGQSSLQGLGARLAGVAGPVALGAGGFVAEFIIGLIVMIVSLYYFLADGPEMIKAVMGLSPLENRYEEQLLQEFGNISRAVVLATLLSAMAQGTLAGFGYYVAGLESVFFLTVLTTVLAMIPFVGAGAVWIPCSLWLVLVENRTWAGILLAIYGALVVSMVDNLIKPTVLHGRSNLHPLLALLSVLGGVKALGPIGIFVGPMVLAFLQTLLNMLSHELTAWEDERGGKLEPKHSAARRPEAQRSQIATAAADRRPLRTGAIRPRKR